MESLKTIILGYNEVPYHSFKPLPNATEDVELKYLSLKLNPHGRLLLALMQYLQQYTRYFDRIHFVVSYDHWPNGTAEGLAKKISGSEIDLGVNPVYMNEDIAAAVDFAYPYRLTDYTFITGKPTYKPHIFGIFQTFSSSVWLTIISVLIVMPILCYAILKRKCTFNKISFHVFAILMRQNSMIRPSSLGEKILVYSWVIGAMILCLSYDSVFLSFLSIPPLIKIKHLSGLALAVERGDYHCIADLHSGIVEHWNNSKQEHLRVIAADIVQNKLSYGTPFSNFVFESPKQNLALFLPTHILDMFNGKFFVSEDNILERMYSMMVRKNFCCKELLDSFVHKMMASGIYKKYVSDATFVASMGLKSLFPDPETNNRKLTLTDVAPAFIFLLTGYIISFLAFKINQKRKRREVYKENPV